MRKTDFGKKILSLKEKIRIEIDKKDKILEKIKEYELQIKELEEKKKLDEAQEIMNVFQQNGVTLEDVKKMINEKQSQTQKEQYQSQEE